MKLNSARPRGRRSMAVTMAGIVGMAGAIVLQSQAASAHEVTTPFPMTCGMTGQSGSFVTSHDPMDAMPAGEQGTYNFKLNLTGAGHNMDIHKVSFTLPKPSVVSSIGAVTFTGTGMTGSSSVDGSGNLVITYSGHAPSSALPLPGFAVKAMIPASTPVGTRIIWNAPANLKLDDTVDTCTATGTPPVILNVGSKAGSGGTTTSSSTTSTTTTTSTTSTTSTTATTASTTTTTMSPGGSWGIFEFLRWILRLLGFPV